MSRLSPRWLVTRPKLVLVGSVLGPLKLVWLVAFRVNVEAGPQFLPGPEDAVDFDVPIADAVFA